MDAHVSSLRISDAWKVQHRGFSDARGSFREWYVEAELREVTGRGVRLRQANRSVSCRGALRGISVVAGSPGQAKYVTCVRGAVLDVVVDLRVGSPTFGQWHMEQLDEHNQVSLFLGGGLGHAFLSLADNSTLLYLLSVPHDPAREQRVQALDPDIGIGWAGRGHDDAVVERHLGARPGGGRTGWSAARLPRLITGRTPARPDTAQFSPQFARFIRCEQIGPDMHKVLVTGGAGFIGSHLVDRLIQADDVEQVTVVDCLTYAGDRRNLAAAADSPKLRFVEGDIRDSGLVRDLMLGHSAVVHLAAESHVDRSLRDVGNCVGTNVVGTQTLLDAAMRCGIGKFVHVSTDEVYGPLPTGTARESDPLRPTVPYAASKAASDLMATSYFISFDVPVCITRSSNNYGPRQHPEKLIPLFLRKLLSGQPVTVHGHGQHIRNWLHVEDHCRAIELVLRQGVPGEIYNIGGGTDLTTLELTGRLLRAVGAGWDSVTTVPDRTANDLRYSMDWSKVAELGFRPRRDLASGLAETVHWYRGHQDRWPATALPNPATADAGPELEAVGA